MADTDEERAELLHMVARLADLAHKAEAQAVEARKELQTARDANSYWLSEHNRLLKRVGELEARVAELSAPLAELLRSS